MKEKIRSAVLQLGADVCGFASAEGFDQAPAGFRPGSIFNNCKSVVVFGIALPRGLYEVDSRFIYSHYNSLGCPQADHIALQIARLMEDRFEACAVPLPCDSPYEYWEEEKMEGRGLISMKHAACLAGLGTLGKNTLLLNKEYGNRLVVGCVLTDQEIEPDEPAVSICPDNCRLCIENCPQGAIKSGFVEQKTCRLFSYGKTKRGFETVECNRCRTVCPMRFGIKKGKEKV
ncbi:MAG: hypothetical protein K0R23_1546 [Lacrimispora sp.]|jgi:epoxyqueuosine reductase QueG|nr:hypothetical protein [Lacrimispora sp.]